MPCCGDGARFPFTALAHVWAGAALGVLLSACTAAPVSGPDGPLVFETATEEGVEVARNLSGSVWEAPRRLVEQIAIGESESEDAVYMFGHVAGLWVAHGRVYVLDPTVPAVRAYDLDGSYLYDIGGGGQGPGEFGQPNGLAVDRAGRVLVADGDRHLLHVYAPEGDLVETWSWRHGGSTFGPRMLLPEPGGGAWVGTFDLEAMSLDRLRAGYLWLDASGQAEPSLQPDVPGFSPTTVTVETEHGSRQYDWLVPFAPTAIGAMDESGNWYVGSGEEYRIWVFGADGRQRVIEKYHKPIAVLPEEAEAHLRAAEAQVRIMDRLPDWRWNGPPVPEAKRAYTSLLPDRSGRLWVERMGPGYAVPGCDLEIALRQPRADSCWAEQRVWDVFGPDGRYLGEVPAPAGSNGYALMSAFIEDERVALALPDDEGNPRVVVYRLEPGLGR